MLKWELCLGYGRLDTWIEAFKVFCSSYNHFNSLAVGFFWTSNKFYLFSYFFHPSLELPGEPEYFTSKTLKGIFRLERHEDHLVSFAVLFMYEIDRLSIPFVCDYRRILKWKSTFLKAPDTSGTLRCRQVNILKR